MRENIEELINKFIKNIIPIIVAIEAKILFIIYFSIFSLTNIVLSQTVFLDS